MSTSVVKTAGLSSESPPLYRYWLRRTWDGILPVMVWIMLNPSTADDQIDDPTIQACMDFARRNGYGGILVINLFAFRSPHPKVMKEAEDPIGPNNDNFILDVVSTTAREGGCVIAAWGTGGSHLDRDLAVVALLEAHGVEVMCFGKTKDGHPKHPLARGLHRIPRDTKPFRLREDA
jgi:hypothetical protein